MQESKKQTFMSEKKAQINKMWEHLNVTTWKKIYIIWGYLGLSYFLMVNYIAPLFKSYFLIASFDTIFMFYVIIGLMTLIFTILNNFILKLLLLISK